MDRKSMTEGLQAIRMMAVYTFMIVAQRGQSDDGEHFAQPIRHLYGSGVGELPSPANRGFFERRYSPCESGGHSESPEVHLAPEGSLLLANSPFLMLEHVPFDGVRRPVQGL